jgi:hypothetical protein
LLFFVENAKGAPKGLDGDTRIAATTIHQHSRTFITHVANHTGQEVDEDVSAAVHEYIVADLEEEGLLSFAKIDR